MIHSRSEYFFFGLEKKIKHFVEQNVSQAYDATDYYALLTTIFALMQSSGWKYNDKY